MCYAFRARSAKIYVASTSNMRYVMRVHRSRIICVAWLWRKYAHCVYVRPRAIAARAQLILERQAEYENFNC